MGAVELALRLLQSRIADQWFKNLSFTDRQEILSRVWQPLNKGMDYRLRYLLLGKAYDDRRIKNYPMMSSRDYARVYGFFATIEGLTQAQGDIVECGVGRGVSLPCMVYALAFFRMNRVVYAFDSFSGFPAATLDDLGGRVREVGKSPEGWRDTSPGLIASIFERDREQVSRLLRGHDIRLVIIPGLFEDTWPEKLPPRIAFLHVDCDLYESTKVVLERCLPRMSPRGIVILDEYRDEQWPGARKVTDEVCKGYGLEIVFFDNIRRYGIRIPDGSSWTNSSD